MKNIYNEFYEQFIPEITSRLNEFPSWFRGIPNHRDKKPYLGYPTGISRIQYYHEYTSRGYGKGYTGFIVGIYIDSDTYESKFNFLKSKKEKIELKLGESLVWLNTGRAGRIFLRLENDINNKETWNHLITWIIDNLLKIMDAFQEEIQNIKSVNIISNIESSQDYLSEKIIGKYKKMINKNISLNQILYGPPGTGKTYNTINEALKIIDGSVPDDRVEAKERFEELSDAGQIEFVTFHQSYGYEEFVEGIKANTVDGSISYDIEDGIFKVLSRRASKKYEFVKDLKNIDFNDYLNIGDILESKNGKKFKIVDIDDNIYFENELTGNRFLANRETILKNINNEEVMEDGEYYSSQVYISRAIYNKLRKELSHEKKYILIIDEINRGNISKIFGELITLIEPSKRIGENEELKLRLPYSNDEFGVPSNLYIIGTMNTADRSIALMDTALRRRFEFVEMMPDYDVVRENIGTVAEIDIAKMLKTINERVEYLYDRDHTIGHAYFMTLDGNSSRDDLDHVMKNKIIPLLQEYFYDDWKKILLVLNDGFIEEEKQDASKIFDKIDEDYIEDDKVSYRVKSTFNADAYERLCQIR